MGIFGTTAADRPSAQELEVFPNCWGSEKYEPVPVNLASDAKVLVLLKSRIGRLQTRHGTTATGSRRSFSSWQLSSSIGIWPIAWSN